ncbi:MAG: hypothetical protein M3P18_12515, partial [Actinomycetota bacterium]|nr:hypothetical protein [Actinomycetota bacterium]
DELEKQCSGLTLSRTKAITLGPGQLSKITASDQRARAASKELNCLSSPPHRALDYAKGFVATREYGLQNYLVDDAGEVRIREVSLSSGTHGVVNAAFETELGSQRSLVFLLTDRCTK